MNKKGQALVEFIVILPIILMLLFASIDFGMIIYNKNKLENKIGEVVKMVNNNESDEAINDFINSDTDRKTTFKITKDKYITIELSTHVNLITPGLNIILGNPYNIKTSRAVYDE